MSKQDPSAVHEDHCERCGEWRLGKLQWMIYGSWLTRFPHLPWGKEFYCHRCRRIMLLYRIIGFTLLAAIAIAAIATLIWAKSISNHP